MQAGSLELVIGHDHAVILKGKDQVVEVLQVALLAVGQGVYAVAHGPVGHRGQPGVVMRAVGAGLFVDLAGSGGIIIPRHVVGGVGNAGLVKQGLVVEPGCVLLLCAKTGARARKGRNAR